MNIAWIGTGIMGLPMCGHLLGAGQRVCIHSRTRLRAQSLLDRGATWADSPAQAARDADVIFVCVTDTPDVQKVLLADDGVMHGAKAGSIVVDHSTISPSVTRQMADQLSHKQITLLDAPVSGGDIGAKNATLAIMVGGEERAFELVRPLLAIMGKTITHCGQSGAGQLTKLVNQVLVSVTNLAVCEALTLAKNAGLDPLRTIQAVGGGAAASWQLLNLGPRMIANDFAPGFMIDLQQKDLRLVLESAEEIRLTLRAVPLVSELFSQLQKQGMGKLGTQALIKSIAPQS